jgi:hypothetical protein
LPAQEAVGGAGQFGEVYLKIEPLERGAGFEFVDHVKGGVIPGVFMPAVEKGVRQALADGVDRRLPGRGPARHVYDGKTHAVDGKEVAFVTAGRKATIEAIRAANPIVLEPIVSIEIVSPEAAIGDLTGDLSSRRGHITGTNPAPGQHGLDHRRGAAGRDHGLRLAPEVADRRPGQPTRSSSRATRRFHHRCSRNSRRPSGRGKKKSEHFHGLRCQQWTTSTRGIRTTLATTAKSATLPAPASCPVLPSNRPCCRSANVSSGFPDRVAAQLHRRTAAASSQTDLLSFIGSAPGFARAPRFVAFGSSS